VFPAADFAATATCVEFAAASDLFRRVVVGLCAKLDGGTTCAFRVTAGFVASSDNEEFPAATSPFGRRNRAHLSLSFTISDLLQQINDKYNNLMMIENNN
jgi:hypothetical protein